MYCDSLKGELLKNKRGIYPIDLEDYVWKQNVLLG